MVTPAATSRPSATRQHVISIPASMKKNSTGVLPATNPEVAASDGGRGLEGDREDRATDERHAPTHLTGGNGTGNRRARRRDVPR
jgi:hypothetical protein